MFCLIKIDLLGWKWSKIYHVNASKIMFCIKVDFVIQLVVKFIS
jgi:hypothetical protein